MKVSAPVASGGAVSPGQVGDVLSFWAASVLAGELLFCIYWLMPFVVEKSLAVISLDVPAQAEVFGTVWPYYSLLHLAALAIALGLALFGGMKPILRNKPFVVYCFVNAVAILWMVFFRASGVPLYWDYALEFLRLTSLTVLAVLVLAERHYDPRILAWGLVTLLAIPIVLIAFTNMTNFLAEREGRVNAPGLEITSTGHVAAIAVLLGLTLPVSRRLRYALLSIGGISLLQSGSRLPLAFCILIAAFVLWRKTPNFRKRVLSVAAFVLVSAAMILLGSLNATIGERLGTFGNTGGLEEEVASGRAMALVASLVVLSDHPLGYVDSDWAIQEELVRVGFPSHTHSHMLQSYLRFGPLALLFWGFLVTQTVAGFKANSPYAPVLIFILAGSLFDYYGFVTKAMLIVFVITGLNANHILQFRKGSNDSPARFSGSAELQAV